MSAKAIGKCAEGDKGRALLAVSFAAAKAAGMQASPSWLLNGKIEMRARGADEIRSSFCERNGEAAGCATPIAEEPDAEPAGAAGDACE